MRGLVLQLGLPIMTDGDIPQQSDAVVLTIDGQLGRGDAEREGVATGALADTLQGTGLVVVIVAGKAVADEIRHRMTDGVRRAATEQLLRRGIQRSDVVVTVHRDDSLGSAREYRVTAVAPA